VHGGVTYRFASAANRAAFLAEPGTYLPQYGGYCAYGMARGYKAVVETRRRSRWRLASFT
jgi:hypothetical protein